MEISNLNHLNARTVGLILRGMLSTASGMSTEIGKSWLENRARLTFERLESGLKRDVFDTLPTRYRDILRPDRLRSRVLTPIE